jgi:ribosomal protein S18 acetylase RimI-like enzyme
MNDTDREETRSGARPTISFVAKRTELRTRGHGSSSDGRRMVEGQVQCRVAAPGDAAGIYGVLAEAAPEIPLLIDTRERQDAIANIIDNCIATGESQVATVSGGGIVGFILVEPDAMERFQHDNHALHLSYAGVTKAYRQQGIFRSLVNQVMRRSVPLTATVKAANQCQIATLLRRSGFQRWSGDLQIEDHFRWQPVMAEAIPAGSGR